METHNGKHPLPQPLPARGPGSDGASKAATLAEIRRQLGWALARAAPGGAGR